MKSICQKDIHTPVFMAANFTIPKKWSHSMCPSVDEWTRKMCSLRIVNSF